MDTAPEGTSAPVNRRTTRVLQGFAAVLALATVVGIVLLRPQGEVRIVKNALGVSNKLYPGHVIRVIQEPCLGTKPQAKVICNVARVQLKSGPDFGQIVSVENVNSPSLSYLHPNDDIVLYAIPKQPLDTRYGFADPQRRGTLLLLAFVFTIFVVGIGRLRGLAAAGSLVASGVVIFGFMLPALIDGRSPLLVALVGSSAIAFFVLYLAHGFKPVSAIAIIGTLISLVIMLFFGIVFVGISHFTGFASSDTVFLHSIVGRINVGGVVLVGITVAVLGALNDITVMQASAVLAAHADSPALEEKKLRKLATKIGRDHIASTINTLGLAYAGSIFLFLAVFALSGQSVGTIANSEVVAIAIVGALVGSIGLAVAVPITTFFAARVVVLDYETHGPVTSQKAVVSGIGKGTTTVQKKKRKRR